MEQTSMTDILSDKEKPAPEAAPAEAPKEEPKGEPVSSVRKEHQRKEWEAQGRDPETGQFKPKEEPKQEAKTEPAKEEPKQEVKAPPKQELTDKEKAFLATAQDERRKRQELERRFAALEKKEPEKGFWDDPEGALAKHKAEISSEILKTRLSTAEAIARGRYKDFDEKVQRFAKLVETVPGIHQQWLAAADPAEFAYQAGKVNLELEQAGSMEAYREKVRKEERQRLEAEYKKKEEELKAERAKIPPSLGDVRGAPQQQKVWSGPTSFDEILKG